MRHVLACIMAIPFLANLAPAQLSAGEKASKSVRLLDDDSLPKGALFRLGKYHFYHPGANYPGASAFVYARDSRHLLTVSGWQKTMKTWDLANGRPLTERTLTDQANAFAISPDGKMLAGISYASMLNLWSADTGAFLGQIDKAGGWRVAFSGDGTRLFDIGTAGIVQEMDIATKKKTRRTVLANLPKDLRDNDYKTEFSGNMAFSQNGKTVAGFFRDHVIHVWDVASGKELHRLKEPERKTRLLNRPLTFSRDGKLLASVGPPLTVSIWEVATGRKLRSLKLGADLKILEEGADQVPDLSYKHLIAFSPDGAYLAGWAQGQDEIKLWATATGKDAKRFPILPPILPRSWTLCRSVRTARTW